jgi:hypothetical protein
VHERSNPIKHENAQFVFMSGILVENSIYYLVANNYVGKWNVVILDALANGEFENVGEVSRWNLPPRLRS